MITIHWDFTDGTEVSYIEGNQLKDNFTTSVLNFFTYDNEASDVVVVRSDGKKISRNELISNSGLYTQKEIRKEHDIHKMLVSRSFNWK